MQVRCGQDDYVHVLKRDCKLIMCFCVTNRFEKREREKERKIVTVTLNFTSVACGVCATLRTEIYLGR